MRQPFESCNLIGNPHPKATAAASAHAMEREVVKLAEAKWGFVLLRRRWTVERSFGWVTPFRRRQRISPRGRPPPATRGRT